KQVCISDEIGKSFTALQTAVGSTYGVVFCGGSPDNEPSCMPRRTESVNGSTVYTGASSAQDGDGEGIAAATDNCSSIFNPVRPLDNGSQADFDGDAVGDVCDVCPLDPNTTMCTVFDPNDADSDGVTNAADNCQNTPNPGQEDADTDGKG